MDIWNRLEGFMDSWFVRIVTVLFWVWFIWSIANATV